MGLSTGLLAGLGVGLAFTIMAALMDAEPAEEIRWSWLRMRSRIGAWLLVGLGVALVAAILVAVGLIGVLGALLAVLAGVLVSALVWGLRSGLVGGLSDERTTPNEGIYRSIRYALAMGLLTGLIVWVTISLLSGLVSGLGFGIIATAIGGLAALLDNRIAGKLVRSKYAFALSIALVAGLTVGMGHALSAGIILGLLTGLSLGGLACLQHLAMRILLAVHDFAPLRYIYFLNDATERVLLHRAGSGYIFVHRLLLEYFADCRDSLVRF